MNITEKEFEKIIHDNESRLKHLCRIYANHEGEEKDLFQKSLFRYGDLSLCLTAKEAGGVINHKALLLIAKIEFLHPTNPNKPTTSF